MPSVPIGASALPHEASTARDPLARGGVGALPPTLPDGRPWPSVAVLVGEGTVTEVASSSASVARQGYPEAQVLIVAGDPVAWARAVDESRAEFLLPLDAGDLLAPDALAALVLAARLDDLDLVVGLRLLEGGGESVLETISISPCAEEDPLGGLHGEALVSRAAIVAAGGVSPLAGDPAAELWRRLLRRGARVGRVGRPVLIRGVRDGERAAVPHPLRIAGLNDNGFSGGAGIAHRRLLEAARLAGHTTQPWRLNDVVPSVAAEWTERFPGVVREIAAWRPDLVLAANLHGATRSSAVLADLQARVPVAAVLHDLFLLTGRCNHPGPCKRAEGPGCDAACPTPTLYPQLAPDRIAAAFTAKREVLRSSIVLLANSRWTRERAEALAPAATSIRQVALPTPAQIFRPPEDKRALRRRLGLSEDDVLVVFGAVIADQPDKGWDDLLAACRTLARPGLGFVAIGRIDDPSRCALSNLTLAGPVADEAVLADWFGACDIHVTASRLETFGQTAVEAGLCGVPTIAYRLTGLTSAVIDGVSGLLVEPREGALAEALAALAADAERRSHLGAWGRLALESRHSHGAAALSLHESFVADGLQPAFAARIGLGAGLLGTFGAASLPLPGATATVARPASPVTAWARWLKQRLWGRSQPLWMRRLLYAAWRLRRVLHSSSGTN